MAFCQAQSLVTACDIYLQPHNRFVDRERLATLSSPL